MLFNTKCHARFYLYNSEVRQKVLVCTKLAPKGKLVNLMSSTKNVCLKSSQVVHRDLIQMPCFLKHLIKAMLALTK